MQGTGVVGKKNKRKRNTREAKTKSQIGYIVYSAEIAYLVSQVLDIEGEIHCSLNTHATQLHVLCQRYHKSDVSILYIEKSLHVW